MDNALYIVFSTTPTGLGRCRFAGAGALSCPTLRDLEGLLEGHVVYEGSALPLTRNGQRWGFSALSFALYHVCIMDRWFHPFFLLLSTAGLAAGRLIFNTLDWGPSWLIHMGANLAANTIGLRLFGILG